MLNDLNDAIDAGGGSWVKLNVEGQTFEGDLLDAEVREKQYQGKVVLSSKSGKPRKEWILTFEDVDGDVRNVAASEGGQIAIRAAVQKLGRNLAKGDHVKIIVTESSVQGESGAEWAVSVTGGKAADDEPPF